MGAVQGAIAPRFEPVRDVVQAKGKPADKMMMPPWMPRKLGLRIARKKIKEALGRCVSPTTRWWRPTSWSSRPATT